MVIKAAELTKSQPSPQESCITNITNTSGILSRLWFLPWVSVGSGLGWAHSSLRGPASSSGALIRDLGLCVLGAAGLGQSGMASARMSGEHQFCFTGFIFQQANKGRFSGPQGRPSESGNPRATSQAPASIISAHSSLGEMLSSDLS